MFRTRISNYISQTFHPVHSVRLNTSFVRRRIPVLCAAPSTCVLAFSKLTSTVKSLQSRFLRSVSDCLSITDIGALAPYSFLSPPVNPARFRHPNRIRIAIVLWLKSCHVFVKPKLVYAVQYTLTVWFSHLLIRGSSPYCSTMSGHLHRHLQVYSGLMSIFWHNFPFIYNC